MLYENDIVKFLCLYFIRYLYFEDYVFRYWIFIKVRIICKFRRKYRSIILFFFEIIRRKVVYYFGIEV